MIPIQMGGVNVTAPTVGDSEQDTTQNGVCGQQRKCARAHDGTIAGDESRTARIRRNDRT